MTHKRTKTLYLSIIPALSRDQLTLPNAVRKRLSQRRHPELIKQRNLGKTVDPSSRLG